MKAPIKKIAAKKSMADMPLKPLLEKFKACHDAVVWASDKTLKEGWETCERGDHMLWLAWHLIGNRRDTVAEKGLWYARAACADTALPIFEKRYPKDARVRECIQGIRDYADGKIDINRLRVLRASAAAAAAYAAAAAAYAAAAAAAYAAAAYAADAYAADAYAAAAAAYAADAYAADAAADAADAYAAAAAYADARSIALKTCADLVRQHLPWKVIFAAYKRMKKVAK